MRLRRVAAALPATAAIGAVLVWGCGEANPAEEPERVAPVVVLALDRAGEAEDVVRLLIERQRTLFAAIRGGASDLVAQQIRTNFAWSPPFRSQPGTVPAPEAGYLEVLGGWRPESLAAMPAVYEVNVLLDDLAWVYAERADGAGGIVTEWRRAGGEWRATWARDVPTDAAAWRAARGQRPPAR